MAAGGSRFTGTQRGVTTGQGAVARREGQAPFLSTATQVYVPAIDSLEEICGLLGTFRERLRMARADEQPPVAATVRQLEARYQQRRAELS